MPKSKINIDKPINEAQLNLFWEICYLSALNIMRGERMKGVSIRQPNFDPTTKVDIRAPKPTLEALRQRKLVVGTDYDNRYQPSETGLQWAELHKDEFNAWLAKREAKAEIAKIKEEQEAVEREERARQVDCERAEHIEALKGWHPLPWDYFGYSFGENGNYALARLSKDGSPLRRGGAFDNARNHRADTWSKGDNYPRNGHRLDRWRIAPIGFPELGMEVFYEPPFLMSVKFYPDRTLFETSYQRIIVHGNNTVECHTAMFNGLDIPTLDHLRWALFEAEHMESLRRRMWQMPIASREEEWREQSVAARLVTCCEDLALYVGDLDNRKYAYFDFLPVVHDKRCVLFADVPTTGGAVSLDQWYCAYTEIILPSIDEAVALTHEENIAGQRWLAAVREKVVATIKAYEVKYVRS